MTSKTRELLEDAMRLPRAERAELAAGLLKAGESQGRPWEEVKAELLRKHFPNG